MRKTARRQTIARSIACAAALTGAALPGTASANAGFGLNDGLTDWTANAYAGEAAKAYDAGTAWTNPAGMINIEGIEFDNSVNFIDPSLNFKGEQQFNGTTITGPNSQHGIDPAITVGSGTVIRLTPDLAVGFSAQSPFASRLSFTPEEYTGRYQDINSIPTVVQGIFSGAYRVTNKLSIGGGPMISYFKDRQTHALALDETEALGANVGPLVDPSGEDPIAQFRGDDLSVGYDIGALYQFNKAFRVGVNYHSAVYSRLQGFQTIYIPPGILNTPGPFSQLAVASLKAQTYDANVKQAVPGWVDTSFYWQINPQWAVLGNATWTDWSIFQNSRVNPDAAGIPITTNIQYNFHDTVTAGIGANYTPVWQKKLMLQAGVTYDESPVDDSTRQGSIPDGDRIEFGTGATYHVNRMLTLDIAYSHYLFFDRNNIDNGIGNQTTVAAGLGPVTLPSGTLVGHYIINDNTLSVGIKSTF